MLGRAVTPTTERVEETIATGFKRVRINFDPTGGREQRESATVIFDNPVPKAESALNGFDIGFTGRNHHAWLASDYRCGCPMACARA